MLYLIIFTFFSLFLPSPALAVDCSFPASGNTTITQDCTLTADAITGVDEASNNETSTSNTAVLTISSGTLTIPSGVLGTTKLAVGTLVLSGGTLVIGSADAELNPGTPIYVADADADGWPDSTDTFYDATSSGRRRRSLMHDLVADCSDASHSQNNSCGVRRNIAITYSGTALTDYDVLITLDTATPIAATTMTADCGDIRLVDSDDTTALVYWIEGGCNTATTQIWARVPSIPDGGKTIYLTADGATADTTEAAYAGNLITLNTVACPSGWTSLSGTAETFDAKFPQGASTYGTTGGSSTSSHTQASCTSGASTVNSVAGSATGVALARHTHTHSVRSNITNNTSVWPSYVDVPFCSKSKLDFVSGQMALFATAAPTGWTRITALDSAFPRGAASYGTTGGATTHTHSTTNGGSTASATETMTGVEGSRGGVGSHTHSTVATTTGAGTHTPAYLNMVFASRDADGAIPAGGITLTDTIPPLGWSRFTALDSKFPRGASTYGGTGGSATHNHSVSINPNVGGGTQKNAEDNGFSISETNHDHSTCSTTASASSNTPPYVDTIYIQKNDNSSDGLSVVVTEG